MAETHPHPKRSAIGIWSATLTLVGFVLVGMAVGSMLGAGLIAAIWGGGSLINDLGNLDQLTGYEPQKWLRIILFQAIGHLFTFLIPALLYWTLVERRKLSGFNLQTRESYRDLLPIFFLTVALMPFTGLVAEWNEGMKLPDLFSELELWMKNSENRLAGLTEFLMSFQTYGELVVAVVVVAVIPAVGEEVLFRGILQRKLAEHWANVHLAIWVSAFIFSAIHFQFYGFLPRLFLGAMFGYLYYWTGSLAMPIFSHFVNNAVTVVLMWAHKQEKIDLDIRSMETVPLWAGLISLAVSAMLMRVIYRASPESASV